MKVPPSLASLLALSLLACIPSQAATVTYQFTGHSLAPSLSGVPAGVTASNFLIGNGFTLTDDGAGADSIRYFG